MAGSLRREPRANLPLTSLSFCSVVDSASIMEGGDAISQSRGQVAVTDVHEKCRFIKKGKEIRDEFSELL